MGDEVVRYELRDSVAVIRIDDGKANALSPAIVASLHERLERAEKDEAAVLLVGRPGRFSAGFDLSVMRQGGEAARSLVLAGAELALRLFGFPRPVVIACSGHAVAMGAVLLLSADLRLGVEGDFKIVLNEVAIGMPLPMFAVELSRQRLSKRHLTRAALLSETYDPRSAVDAGFLDRLLSPESLFDEALREAQRLATLDTAALRNTKLSLRGTALAYIRDTLEENMKQVKGPTT
jgi:enoyl-CoA hydratase